MRMPLCALPSRPLSATVRNLADGVLYVPPLLAAISFRLLSVTSPGPAPQAPSKILAGAL
eukprot:9499976-Pyramimonas_sp.AAC.1